MREEQLAIGMHIHESCMKAQKDIGARELFSFVYPQPTSWDKLQEDLEDPVFSGGSIVLYNVLVVEMTVELYVLLSGLGLSVEGGRCVCVCAV